MFKPASHDKSFAGISHADPNLSLSTRFILVVVLLS